MTTIAEFSFTNAGELQNVLGVALATAKLFGASPDMVYIVTRESSYSSGSKLRLLEETMTDGSKAYSISIRS